ncbi:MAG: bifunctional phosphoribosylaminoimidazolecarboxamide formyltransferase/IMP cyclohydrolase [Hadesarchaea archaeon]|nr:bifunctional phosphoribosylaminoimidazolecarboxamide formyltransferase/IMP cyclohydrolase [Hadesarchaea archaeon]
MRIARALISVSDKTGIVEFARGLQDLGIEIISTGGTAKFLKKNGIKVKDISDFTGFPEILDGRVKTLHPKVHGGILAIREKGEHIRELRKHDIEPIDLVIVNLYPFEKTIQSGGTIEEAIENIDIGGPAMLRSAAKNYRNVVVIVNPNEYNEVLKELREKDGELSDKTRERLAVEAFAHTARYDTIISNYLRGMFRGEEFPETLSLTYKKIQNLRYGANPHQKAAFYGEDIKEPSIANARKLWGKELSYNNILDLGSSLEVVKEFENPTCVIVKHTNPIGVATAEMIFDAYKLAHQTDPISEFGGIVALNREVDADTAREMSRVFLDAIIAPKFSREALDILKKKKNIRLLEIELEPSRSDGKEIRSVVGGLLVQERDIKKLDLRDLKIVTKRAPTDEEIKSLLFAFKVVKYCKSNALVFTKGERTIAVSFGQPSRVDAARVAVNKSGEKVKGAVVASDGFLPFRDVIDVVAGAGVTAIIQPGGSIRDQEVIDAANEYGIAMVFSGMRVFKH